MYIAQNIARLRRERGMTQEALAEVIGVSPQTISKWENSATWPDVALLPVIADAFGVTIDVLYGREESRRILPADTAVEQVLEAVREIIVSVCYDPETDGKFEDNLARYRKVMQSDASARSVIENDREVLYFREAIGALALRKPEEGWNSLFARDDAAALLHTLADSDFRRAMQLILQKRMLTFTIPALMQQCSIQDAAHLEECLAVSGCFVKRELIVDERPLVYYELVHGEMKLYLLYAVMIFAREYTEYKGNHYCFFGNSNYYTP